MMLETAIARYASPTLAFLKPASLFSVPFEEMDFDVLDFMNRQFHKKDIHFIVLAKRKTHFLVYVYQKQLLKDTLFKERNRAFLLEHGYLGDGLSTLIDELSQRLCDDMPFPHEIGIFLGYPLDDVIGFIEHEGKDALACGTWKVYHNVLHAEWTFARYRACTAFYLQKYNSGMDLTEIIYV